MHRKYYITSNGCAVLLHETERISKYFRLNGWDEESSPSEADFVVVTCCGFTQNEEDVAIDMIRSAYGSTAAGARFVVSGCLPGFARERIMATAARATLLSYQELGRLDEMIDAVIPFADVHFNVKPTAQQPVDATMPADPDELVSRKIDEWCGGTICREQYRFCTMHRYLWQEDDVFQIKVSYGCPGNCTYCATKLGIGNFRSVDKAEVLCQYKEGLEKGYRHFLLIGDEIGSYGSDFGDNIVHLLEEMYALCPTAKVSIRYVHPDILVRYYEGLRFYFSVGFVDYFCCAIQSASPRILKLMGRNTDVEPFVKCMEDLRRNAYPVNIHTQIIVGFPTETADDFLLTLRALIRCDFDHININMYSPRKGTRAYSLTDDISLEEKQNRRAIIRAYLDNNKRAKLYGAVKQSVLNTAK